MGSYLKLCSGSLSDGSVAINSKYVLDIYGKMKLTINVLYQKQISLEAKLPVSAVAARVRMNADEIGK